MSGRVGSITTDIIADGLVCNFDAANRASYPAQRTFAISESGSCFNTLDLSQSGSFISDPQFITQPISASCWAFDGVDDKIYTGITTTGTNDVSISCWIKTTETFVYTLSRTAFGGRNNTFGDNYTIGRLGSGFATPNDMVVRVFNTFGTTKLNDDNWHNIIYTWDYSTGELKAYVDGNTTAEATVTVFASTNYTIAIGWNGFNDVYNFEGLISNAQMYYRVLSSNEVLHNYNALKGRFGL